MPEAEGHFSLTNTAIARVSTQATPRNAGVSHVEKVTLPEQTSSPYGAIRPTNWTSNS